jgi:hypothetical protein
MSNHVQDRKPEARMSIPRIVLLALLGLGLSAHFCFADVVHLRTGEAIKGTKVQEDSDEERLVIIDVVSGARRTLRWEVVDPADKERIWEEWQWLNKAQSTFMGTVVQYTLNDGTVQEVRGVIVREDSEVMVILENGVEKPVAKSRIRGKPQEEAMDPREIWSTEQLWERYLEGLRSATPPVDVDNMDAQQHFLAGKYAEWITALDEAETHYQAAANDPDYPQAGVAAASLTRVQELKRDQVALDKIKRMKQLLLWNNFRRVKEMQTAFEAEHPEVGEVVELYMKQLNTKLKKQRDKYMRNLAQREFPRIVIKLIETKVKEKDLTLTDATSWTKRELPTLAFEALAERMQKADDVNAAEAQAFWDARKKRIWSSANYGSGTFIISPAKVKPARSSGGANRQNAGPKLPTPKPLTRDEWWAQKKKERASWVMAFFVERSELFEVDSEPKLRPCPKCNGEGLESKTTTSGATWQYRCTRCAGSQYDRSIRYR